MGVHCVSRTLVRSTAAAATRTAAATAVVAAVAAANSGHTVLPKVRVDLFVVHAMDNLIEIPTSRARATRLPARRCCWLLQWPR